MSRPEKFIPLEDIKGLKTFLPALEAETITFEQVAKYYSEKLGYKVGRMTISRRIEELKK